MRDADQEDHDEYFFWIDGSFDPEAFDLAEINAQLGSMGQGRSTESVSHWAIPEELPFGDYLNLALLCNGNNSMQEIVHILARNHSENLNRVTDLVNRFISEAIIKSVVIPLNYQKLIPINVSGSYSTIFPFFAQIELTKYCPLRCLHCFNSSGKRKPGEIDTSGVMMVLDKLEATGVRKLCLQEENRLQDKILSK